MENIDLSLMGKRVKARRKSIKLSQAELAEQCGVSTAYVGHIERGNRSPSVEMLLLLCKALSVTPDYLLQDYLQDVASSHFTESDAQYLEHLVALIREPARIWPDAK